MTKQERIKIYVEKLKPLTLNDDCVMAHSEADDILSELLQEIGYGEVADMYDAVCKWYE